MINKRDIIILQWRCIRKKKLMINEKGSENKLGKGRSNSTSPCKESSLQRVQSKANIRKPWFNQTPFRKGEAGFFLKRISLAKTQRNSGIKY